MDPASFVLGIQFQNNLHRPAQGDLWPSVLIRPAWRRAHPVLFGAPLVSMGVVPHKGKSASRQVLIDSGAS